MNVEAFVAEFRRVMADTAAPYLWSDEEVVTYLNDAEREACERALLLEDRTTPAVCNVALVALQSDYRLHASIFRIKRLTYLGRQLTETSVELMDAIDSNWESRSGQPIRFIFNEAFGVRIVPTPNIVGAIKMTVYRLPLKDLSADSDAGIPEIPLRHHARLLSWVYRSAYLKQDSQTYNYEKAQAQELAFTDSFGKRPDANVMRKQADKAPNVVRMQW